MKPVTRLLLALICLLLATVGPLAQQKPSRLLVTNKTGSTLELFALVESKWQSRGRINAGFSMPVYNVTNDQRFRAAWGSQSEEHTVKLTYNRAYGGLQDDMIVPRSAR